MADPPKPVGSSPPDKKTTEDLAKAMQSVKDSAAQASRSFNEQLHIVTQMRDAMAQMAGSIDKMNDSSGTLLSGEKWSGVTKKIEATQDAAESTTSTMTKLGSYMTGAMAKGLVVVSSGFTGLFQGFKNVFSLGKGLLGVFSSIVGGLFEVGAAIVAIPFKLLKSLFSMATNAGGSNELMVAMEAIRKEFGAFSSVSSKTIISVSKDMAGFSATGLSTWRVFGTLAQRLEAVTKLAQGMGAQFAVNADEIKKTGGAILGYQKGLGLTEEMIGTIAAKSRMMGTSVGKVLNDMTKQSMGMAKAFGLDAKVISRDMGKAMQDLSHFGHLSSKELSIAATYANKLGVSVDKLTSVMDATSTFDQAAEGMSKLNEQYGTNIDATEIMMAQNPADKIEILRKQFAATGKDMSMLTYQDRMLIKSTSGLSDEMLDAAFAAKNAGTNLASIRKEGEKNEKKTLTQADAMGKLADAIERLTPSGSAGQGGILDHIMDGISRGLQTTPEFIGLMRNINMVLRQSTMFGIQLGKMIANLFPGIKDISSGLRDLFNPKVFSKLFGDIMGLVHGFSSGSIKSFDELMSKLKDKFFNFFNAEEGPGKKILDGFSKFGKAILKTVTTIGGWAWDKLGSLYQDFLAELKNPSEMTKAIKTSLVEMSKKAASFIGETFVPVAREVITTITKFLRGGEKLASLMPGSSDMGKFAMEILGPMGEALKAAWVVLKDPLLELGKEVVNLIWDGLKTAFFAMPLDAKLAIAATVIAPAISNMLFSLGTMKLLGSGLKGLGSWIAKSLGKEVAEAGAEALAKKGAQAAAAAAAETSTVAVEGAVASSATAATGTAATSAFAAAGVGIGTTLAAGVAAGLAGAAAGYAIASGLDHLADIAEESARRENKTSTDNMKRILDSRDSYDEKLKKLDAEALADKKRFDSQWWTSEKEKIEQSARLDYLDSAKKLIKKQEAAQAQAAAEGLTPAIAAARAQAKTLEEARTKVSAEAKEKALKDLGPVTIENAVARFKQIDEMSKKVMGKDFDIEGKLSAVRDKLSKINFSVLDVKKENELNSSVLQLDSVRKLFETLVVIGDDTKKAGSAIANIGDSFKKDSPADKIMGENGSLQAAITSATNIFKSEIFKDKDIKNSSVTAGLVKDLFGSLTSLSSTVGSFVSDLGKSQIEMEKASISVAAIGPSLQSVITTITDMFGPEGVLSKLATGTVSSSSGFGMVVKDVTDSLRSELMTSLTAVNELVAVSKSLDNSISSIPQIDMKAKLSTMEKSFMKLKSVGNVSVGNAVKAVQEMVSAVQMLDKAMSELPNIPLEARMTRIAGMVGLGSAGVYTVKSKEVVINVSFNVSMDVNEVEKIMVGRVNSIIRDRINFAINPGSKPIETGYIKQASDANTSFVSNVNP